MFTQFSFVPLIALLTFFYILPSYASRSGMYMRGGPMILSPTSSSLINWKENKKIVPPKWRGLISLGYKPHRFHANEIELVVSGSDSKSAIQNSLAWVSKDIFPATNRLDLFTKQGINCGLVKNVTLSFFFGVGATYYYYREVPIEFSYRIYFYSGPPLSSDEKVKPGLFNTFTIQMGQFI